MKSSRTSYTSLRSYTQTQPSTEHKLTQTINSLGHLFTVMNDHQNYLQSIRQAIVTRPEFNPKTLFQYLSTDKSTLTKQDIIDFMEQNDELTNQSEIKIVFIMNGAKDKMNYKTFLHFLFPYHKEALGKINIKKYDKNEGNKVSQEVICLFTMIIKGQITFLYQFDSTRKQLFPNMNKESIKKLMDQIKYTGISLKVLQPQSFNNLCHTQIIRSFQHSKFIKKINIKSVLRKLSQCGESPYVTLAQLTFWFRPWDRLLDGLTLLSQTKTISIRQFDLNDSLDEK